jgi:hypothetical protein
MHKTVAASRWKLNHLERTADMTKRNYYKIPKRVSEMTEEEVGTFAAAVYEDLMAKFADELPDETNDNS